MPDVGMPRLSDTMREGAVSQWLVEDGAEVSRGQEILEVETDKATMSYEAEHDGPLRILVPAGVNVAVGDVIATIGDPDPDRRPSPASGSGESSSVPVLASPEVVAPQVDPPPVAAPAPSGRRPNLSPLLRRLARERGVDLDQLQGSGPDGSVLREDIIGASSASSASSASTTPPASADPQRRAPLSRSQRLVADRMSHSQRTVPDFWAGLAVDVTGLVSLRDDLKAAPAGSAVAEVVPTLNDFIVRACALALVEHPRLNAAYDDDHVVVSTDVNVGIAVSTDNGLLVPVVRSAATLTTFEIAAVARHLTEQARIGKIALRDLEGGTFTVSNLGAFGVRAFAPIINAGQAAILGVGAATPTCVPVDGSVTVRSMMELTLTCDHRIVYGADAARFLQTLKGLLEAPAVLL